jgi:tRNA(Phe) wybutosine-synthesizing methylase Tyw3
MDLLSGCEIDYNKKSVDEYIFQIILGINTQAKFYTETNNVKIYEKTEKQTST